MSSWAAPTADGGVHGVARVPGSKSITNRALVLAALATGPSTLTGVLRSRDTDLMMRALGGLGTGVTGPGGAPLGPDETVVRISPGPLTGAPVDCGLAGTVMRFLPAVAALATGASVFDGDPEARVRPQRTVLDALRSLGARVDGVRLPFTVHGAGSVAGGRVEIDASGSSQFVSGLLLAGARFDRGVEVVHVGAGPVPSGPHVEMTLEMLRAAGVDARATGDSGWQVAPGPVSPRDVVVEPDLSNATPFLAAAAVTGGRVRVPHWPRTTTQPGADFARICRSMGAGAELVSGDDGLALEVTGPERLRGVDLDLGAVGELTPTVAAMCALADGPSTLTGIAHLRGHETDRLAALATELGGLGADVTELPDGLRIEPAPLTGGPWRAYADHRMATAGAILGLVVPGVVVDDVDSTAKTLPGFARMWADLLAGRG